MKLYTKETQSNLWQEPGDTSEPFLHFKNGALKPTVGERVLLVEGQPTLIGEVTVPIFWTDLLDVFGRYKSGRQVNEVLKTCVQQLELLGLFERL